MFDRSMPFNMKLLSGTEKKLVFRFPTDDELISRARGLVHEIRANKSEIRGLESSTQKFAASLQTTDPAVELSEQESILLIDRLLRSQPIQTDRQGNRFRVTLKVAAGKEVVHMLDMPTVEFVRLFEKATYKSFPKRNMVESHECLDDVAVAWATLKGACEGYAEGTAPPVIHMQAAIEEVIAQIRQSLDEPDPEE